MFCNLLEIPNDFISLLIHVFLEEAEYHVAQEQTFDKVIHDDLN